VTDLFSTPKNKSVPFNFAATVNLNVLDACHKRNNKRIFYSSSACMYPEFNQTDPDNPNCAEDSAYPANPDSEYGWEKLFSEEWGQTRSTGLSPGNCPRADYVT